MELHRLPLHSGVLKLDRHLAAHEKKHPVRSVAEIDEDRPWGEGLVLESDEEVVEKGLLDLFVSHFIVVDVLEVGEERDPTHLEIETKQRVRGGEGGGGTGGEADGGWVSGWMRLCHLSQKRARRRDEEREGRGYTLACMWRWTGRMGGSEGKEGER